MANGIRHAPVGGVDNPSFPVSKSEWEDDHAGGVVAGSSTIIIPGLAASPDIKPGSPNGQDDEFETTDTSDPMTGWTTLGAPTVHNMNSTALSHYYVEKAAAAGVAIEGIYKAVPGFPYTVTTKITDTVVLRLDFIRGGQLMLLETGPGRIWACGPLFDGGARVAVVAYTSRTVFSSVIAQLNAGAVELRPPYYLRAVCADATHVDFQVSHGGLIWYSIAGNQTLPFTSAFHGLSIDAEQATYAAKAAFDYFRVT